MQPLVSVVIATYNQAKYLGYTIQSVLTQTYPHIELTVVDDGSTDTTPEVATRFGDRVRYIRQPNTERGAARNRGMHESHGELIAFVDSDDIWLPDKVEKEVEYLQQHPEVGLVYSDREFIDAAGRYLGYARAPDFLGRVTRQLLKENFICLSANLCRREELLHAGGFPEDRLIAGSEDWVAWIRLSTRTMFGHLGAVTVLYRIHSANTMNNAAMMECATTHAIEALESADWLDPQFRRVFPYMKANRALFTAINYCTAKQRSRVWRHLWEAACHSPAIIFDPRYMYTALRNTVPSAAAFVSAKRRSWQASAHHR